MTVLRLLESVHGHLGVLAVAALLHPAIFLRRGKPMSAGVRLSVVLSTVGALLAFASGLVVYPAYREHVRATLFARSTTAGLLFETKEHVAFFVLCIAVGAGTCAIVAPRDAPELRRSAAWAYAAAAGLCLLVVAMGSGIASVAGFP